MAILYRGAGVGTYWHTNNARGSGFRAKDPTLPNGAPNPLDPNPYQHNGHPNVVLAVTWPLLAYLLRAPVPKAAGGGDNCRPSSPYRTTSMGNGCGTARRGSSSTLECA
jgi:hypothetical protein